MNVQASFLPNSGDAAYRAAEKMVALNRDLMDKLVSHQIELANDMLDRSLAQFKVLSEAKTIDEVVKAQSVYVEESTQYGLKSTQKVMEIMNESRQAYTVLYQGDRTGKAAIATGSAAPAAAKPAKRAARKRAIPVVAKPEASAKAEAEKRGTQTRVARKAPAAKAEPAKDAKTRARKTA